MLDIVSSIIGGLGLFFLGVKGISASLNALSGRRMRAAMALATRGRLTASLMGLALGVLTQSSNAVTFIATSLYTAGMLPLARALPALAWANAGTAVLVLLAAVDIRLAVLWLLGAAGFATYFNWDAGGRLRPLLGAMTGFGLLFLGLATIKLGAAPLRDAPFMRDMLIYSGNALTPPFLVGAAVTLVAQSSSTVTILAMTLASLGLMGFDQTVMAVYGASFGSGVSVLLLSGNLSGSARQLALFQMLFKTVGTMVFLLLFVIERDTGLPLVLAATGALSHSLQHQMGWLFLLFQLGTALVLAPFDRPVLALLGRLSPPSEAEALGRPRFIAGTALEYPAIALDLVEREQAAFALWLPQVLDTVLAPVTDQLAAHRATLLAASASIELAIDRFLTELLSRGCDRESMARAVLLQNRNVLLASLRETVGEFASTIEPAGDAALQPTLLRLAEALHLLLLQLNDALARQDAEDLALLRLLSGDRSDMMDHLRRRIVQAEPALGPSGHDLLFRATSLFGRGIWLIRRTALLLGDSDAEA
jgi:phosphate:Na+ symporter